MMVWLNTTTGFIIGVCTLLTFLWAGWKWARPHLQEEKADRIAQRDAIIGRPAIIDSITHVEISPALPGIGVRLANTDATLARLTDAVAELAASNRRIDDLDQRVTTNTDDIADLKAQKAERFVGKVEQVQMLRTMEVVARGDQPPLPPEPSK